MHSSRLIRPGETITDTSILVRGDLLEVVSQSGRIALLEILDSHDPSQNYNPALAAAKSRRPIGNHHHVLVQQADHADVIPAGLYIGETGVNLLFAHATFGQGRDSQLVRAMGTLQRQLHVADGLLLCVSSTETLSALPNAQQFLEADGSLRR